MTVNARGNEANYYIKALNNRMQNKKTSTPGDKLGSVEVGFVSGTPNKRQISPEELYSRLENAQQEKSPVEIAVKCVRIAFRIMRGDNVPPEDDKLLLENFPEMHEKAWAMRKIKADPEDCESEIEEEDEGTKVSSGCGSTEADIDMTVEALDITV